VNGQQTPLLCTNFSTFSRTNLFPDNIDDQQISQPCSLSATINRHVQGSKWNTFIPRLGYTKRISSQPQVGYRRVP
jgi:hypothetical protein